MTPIAGSHGKLHRTTKILSHARRRGGVAARGARATTGDAGRRIISVPRLPTIRRTVVSRCVGSANGDCCPRHELATEVGLKTRSIPPKWRSGMRLAAIASALAIVLCVAVFGAILLQKASIRVPASAPPQAPPTESRAPTVADSAAESAVAAPERRQLAQPSAAATQKRIALVIGNAGYQAGALATPANDAGLVAQTL